MQKLVEMMNLNGIDFIDGNILDISPIFDALNSSIETQASVEGRKSYTILKNTTVNSVLATVKKTFPFISFATFQSDYRKKFDGDCIDSLMYSNLMKVWLRFHPFYLYFFFFFIFFFLFMK
jgi:hypothetical protein